MARLVLSRPRQPEAFRAVGTLISDPAVATALLRDKLTPVRKAPSAEIDELIAALDQKDFKTRDDAFRELRRIGIQAKSALESALEKSNSAELRQRIQSLLSEFRPVPSLEELRELRSIEVLEVIGTPEAQQILESLAKGATGINLTDEAAAASKRLAKSR